MNDVHSVEDESHFLHSTFWHAHREYWRVPHGSAAPWVNRALNYAHAAVREHQMSFVRELLERYDADGLELDWMRFGYHFRPGHESEGIAILTEFTANARAVLDDWERKRGHRIRLGARVPSRPQTALGLGYDPVTWARRGLIDFLVVTPFWATAETDMPIELWKQLLAGGCRRRRPSPPVRFTAYPTAR